MKSIDHTIPLKCPLPECFYNERISAPFGQKTQTGVATTKNHRAVGTANTVPVLSASSIIIGD